MLKTAAAGLMLAILPIQNEKVVPVQMEVSCLKGMCMIAEKDLAALQQSNNNAAKAAQACRAGQQT